MAGPKSTPNDRYFEKFLMAIFSSFSEFLPEIYWEEIAEELLFVFRFDVWPGTRTLAFRLVSQHTNYYIIYNTLLHVINNLNLQNSNNCKGNTKLQIAFNVLNWRLWCKFLISQNRQNKVINRHMVNMIFLELKIVQMTINCQIWQL